MSLFELVAFLGQHVGLRLPGLNLLVQGALASGQLLGTLAQLLLEGGPGFLALRQGDGALAQRLPLGIEPFSHVTLFLMSVMGIR